MAKFNTLINTFIKGEIGKNTQGRIDLKDYYQGCETVENYIPMPQGGLDKRTGGKIALLSTPYDSTVYDYKHRVVTFKYSATESYIIQLLGYFSAGTYVSISNMKFSDGTSITGPIGGFGGSWEVGSDDPNDLHVIQYGKYLIFIDTTGITAPTLLIRDSIGVFRTATIDDEVIDEGATGRRALSTPFSSVNIDNDKRLKVSATTGYGTNVTISAEDASANPIDFFNAETNWPGRLRISNGTTEGVFTIIGGNIHPTAWSQALVSAAADTVTFLVNHNWNTGDSVTIAANTGATLPDPLTATTYWIIRTSATAIQFAETLADAQTGTQVNLTDVGSGTFTIAAQSWTQLSFTVLIAAGDTIATPLWSFSAWGGSNGYPRTGTIHNQRLCLAGTPAEPSKIWTSFTGKLFQFMQNKLEQDQGATDASGIGFYGDPSDADPFDFIAGATEANEIQWIHSSGNLLCGTLDNEFSVYAQQGFSPTGIQIVPQSAYGSINVQPVTVGRSTYFVSRNGKSLMEYSYSDENGAYTSTNISILNTDIVHKGATSNKQAAQIRSMSFQRSRNTLWLTTTANKLIAVTITPEAGVLGWHRHEIGNSPAVHSVCAIPNSTNTNDDVWYLALRPTTGTNVMATVEKMGPNFIADELDNEEDSDDEHPIFMDFSTRYTSYGSPLTVWTVGAHYEGRELSVVADGVYIGEYTVASNEITLSSAVEEIIVGYKYTATIVTNPLEAGQQFGTAQGDIKRIDRVLIKLYRTCRISIGESISKLYSVLSGDTMVTQDVVRTFANGPDRKAQIAIVDDSPYPSTILAIGAKGVSYDQ